jgi:hypothetical protein
MHEANDDRRIGFGIVDEEVRKAAQWPKPEPLRRELRPHLAKSRRCPEKLGRTQSRRQKRLGRARILFSDPDRCLAKLPLGSRRE